MNLKSMENVFFQFLNLVYESISHDQITTLILTTYSFNLIFVFLASLPSTHHIFQPIFTSLYIIIVPTAILALLLVQIMIALTLKAQVLLYYQLQFFRYILFPIMLLWLALQITQQTYLLQTITISLYLVLILIALALQLVIKSFTQKQIISQKSYTECSVIADALLITFNLIDPSSIYYELNLFSFVVLCFLTGYQYRSFKIIDKEDKLKYLSQMVKQFICCIILSKNVLKIQIDETLILFISIPLLILFPFIIFINKNKITLSSDIFTGQSSLPELFYFIDLMSNQILTYQQNLNLSIQKSLITTFLSIHKLHCNDASCVLLHKSTHEELKNITQSQNIKVILLKLKKKVESILEMYEKIHPGSIVLKLVMIKFYILHLPNNIKISQLISCISLLQTDVKKRALLFIYYQKISKIQQNEGLHNSTDLTEFNLFRKLMIQIISYFRQFWSQICEESININKLMSILSKLNPLKGQIQTIWNRSMKEQSFISWKMLKLYVEYKKLILHQDLDAIILQDYCKMKEEQLKDKLQLEYINEITSQSVVSISLSESSLGKIVSLNNQAAITFGYSNKSQMLALRVNDIMPHVFSIVHDYILTEFLKNRFKTINQDQRLLYGKNKNNYVFPIKLQLRKMSWNNNDQLIFIANIETLRTKKAPMFCICDLEGEINDYTSNFKWIFMKKKKSFTKKCMNIQEIVPNFFVFIQNNGLTAYKTKLDGIKKVVKSEFSIELQFYAKQIIVKNQKIGYFIEGQQSEKIKSLKQIDMNNRPKVFNVNQTHYYPVHFNHELTQYEFLPKYQQSIKSPFLNQAVTLPYLNQTQFTQFLNVTQKTATNFGQGIKIMRLTKARFQYIGNEQQSFISDDEQQKWKNLSLNVKIDQIKQQINGNNNKRNNHCYQLIIIVINVIMIVVVVLGLIKINYFDREESFFLRNYQNQINIKILLPEILVYGYYVSGSNVSYELARKEAVRQINQYISHSSLDEIEIQTILKTIFDSYSRKYSLYQPDLLLLQPYEDTDIYLHPQNTWYTLITLIIIYLIVLIIMYLYYKKSLESIYLIFTSIKEPIISKYINQTEYLLKIIYNEQMQQNDEDFKIKKLIDKADNNSDEQIQRFKRVKNEFSYKDSINLFKLIFPVILILAFSIYCTIAIKTEENKYDANKSQVVKISQLLPQTSTFLMKNMFQHFNYGNVRLNSTFPESLAQYEYQLNQLDRKNNELQTIMRGDPCLSPDAFAKFGLNTTYFCDKETVLLDLSLQNVLNEMNTILHPHANRSLVDWDRLILLQYKLIKPLLTYNMKTTFVNYQNLRFALERMFSICGGTFILFITLSFAYIMIHPIDDITDNLMSIKDLVSIIPSSSQTQKNNRTKQIFTLPNTDTIENK